MQILEMLKPIPLSKIQKSNKIMINSIDTKFELKDDEFKEIISVYKLNFDQQKEFNVDFDIETDKPKSNSPEDLKLFLKQKLDRAFQDPNKLSNYQKLMRESSESSSRGIHDSDHVANVAMYARNFLKIYQKNKELFSPKIQKEIEVFDDPQKIRDLEILCLLHDVARVDKNYDQDEYKNAFYVALMLRNMGDERFQGDEISEDGLKMIMDLALKESDKEDKSLMSKLIQASDSLAIIRVKSFNTLFKPYNLNLNNSFKDFKEIDQENAEIRNRLLLISKKMLSQIAMIEAKEYASKPSLNLSQNPLQEFLDHPKTQKLRNAFLVFDEIYSVDLANDFAKEYFPEGVFVHVFAPSNADALQKCDSSKFICATMLKDDAIVRHYAEWSWINNPFLILDKDAVIFQAGFKTDVGSNSLFTSFKNRFLTINFGGFQSDIEMSDYVAMNQHIILSDSYLNNMIFHQDEFSEILTDISQRRSGKKTDISDGVYWLANKDNLRKMGRVGLDRYGKLYEKPHFSIEAPSGELRHNECHIRNAIHICGHIGISNETFNLITIGNGSSHISESPEVGLLRMQKYKNQINLEKQRLLALDEPMKDKKFRECVDFELTRVTSIFEKIYFLERMRREIESNPYNEYWIKSSQKKQRKKAEFEGYNFENSDENREIWSQRKIQKINRNLVELYANLRGFEKEENFGFNDLLKEYKSLNSVGCTSKSFGVNILDWKAKIMNGESHSKQLSFAIDKVRVGLQKKTKMALLSIYNPQEVKIVTDEDIDERFKEIKSDSFWQKRLFLAFLNNQDYLKIFKTFNREEINDIVSNIKFNKEFDLDKVIFEKKFPRCEKDEIIELIQAGLDIYKFDDKEKKSGCFGVGFTKTIKPYSYELAKEFDNKEVIDLLLEYGVLVSDRFELQENKAEKDMAKFCKLLKSGNSEILDQLKLELEKYETKEDLKKLTIFSLDGSEVKLNGYGLLRIYENNLIPNPSSEISNLFKKLNAFKCQDLSCHAIEISQNPNIGGDADGIALSADLVFAGPNADNGAGVVPGGYGARQPSSDIDFKGGRATQLTLPPSLTNKMG